MTNMWALYAREVKRFQKMLLDTVFSPIVSLGLYLLVMGVVVGDQFIDGVPYLAFVYTGLLGMTLVNSSFSNPAFALIISKNVGTVVDLQVAPIKAWQIGIAYALAAATRAVLTVTFTVLLSAWLIPGLGLEHPLLLVLAVILSGLEFGMLGVAVGMWAKNFEALTFMTTFVMQPMIFLAGVFYPLANLPQPWNVISTWNPLHHTINLLRYAATGYADTTPWISLSVIVGICVALFVIMQYVTKKGLRT